MIDSTDAAAAVIAAKMVTGERTTRAEQSALGQAWVNRQAVAAWQEDRVGSAAIMARDDPANRLERCVW
jgi:hypothetical protein